MPLYHLAFDVLNSCSLLEKCHKAPIKPATEHHAILKEVKKTGHCLCDIATIHNSTSVTVNIAFRVDEEPVEVLALEDETLSDLPDGDNLPEYKESAIFLHGLFTSTDHR